MCTTGVLRIGDGDYLLFKNKDFGRTHFDDRLVTEQSVFGVQGVTTWAGTDPDLDQFSGFSIGANEHGLLCCDSNVRTLDGHANYDELTEIALREGRDVDSAVTAVQEAVESKPYLWANLIMIDSAGAAAVEVRSDRVEATALTGLPLAPTTMSPSSPTPTTTTPSPPRGGWPQPSAGWMRPAGSTTFLPCSAPTTTGTPASATTRGTARCTRMCFGAMGTPPRCMWPRASPAPSPNSSS